MTRPATTALLKTAGVSATERASAVAAAAEALSRGLLAVLPMETVYGLAAGAHSRDALDRLAQASSGARPGGAGGPAAWHAHSVDLVRSIVQFDSPVHRRLVRRLLPGPVTFLVERPAHELEAIRERLGAAPGSLHNGNELALRVPDHALAREVLAAAWERKTPVVAEGIAAAGLGRGTSIPAEFARSAMANEPSSTDWIAVVLDDGPTRFGKPSTVVRLMAGHNFEVISEGVLEERFIRKQLDRNILFVCTGNTCRSPMAEAIADHLLASAQTASPIRTRVRSAGAFALGGEPVSPEAVRAVESLGIAPGDLARHTSRELTRQMVAEADIIFAMTGGHARAVTMIDPTAAAKVVVLDPSGADVPDPIGGPQELYTRTANRLKELIQRRLDELDRA